MGGGFLTGQTGRDYDQAIWKQGWRLFQVVLGLFAMAGLTSDVLTVETLSRRNYRAILRLLRPAESALRRLIVIVAHQLLTSQGIVTAFKPGKAPLAGAFGRLDAALAQITTRMAAFQLIDPLKQYAFNDNRVPFAPHNFNVPRICIPGVTERYMAPEYHAPRWDDPISARAICTRLTALRNALESLPKQAKRLARWQARRAFQRAAAPLKPIRTRVLLHNPPGQRKDRLEEVDDIFHDCRYFAREIEDMRSKPG
jgi:hypothetical protein